MLFSCVGSNWVTCVERLRVIHSFLARDDPRYLSQYIYFQYTLVLSAFITSCTFIREAYSISKSEKMGKYYMYIVFQINLLTNKNLSLFFFIKYYLSTILYIIFFSLLLLSNKSCFTFMFQNCNPKKSLIACKLDNQLVREELNLDLIWWVTF